MMPFSLVMIFLGAYYAFSFMNIGSSYLGIPLGIIYMVLPIIGILLFVELVLQIIKVKQRG
jgi:TRAP-type C4-dicarboxylate transport system permease small subunit